MRRYHDVAWNLRCGLLSAGLVACACIITAYVVLGLRSGPGPSSAELILSAVVPTGIVLWRYSRSSVDIRSDVLVITNPWRSSLANLSEVTVVVPRQAYVGRYYTRVEYRGHVTTIVALPADMASPFLAGTGVTLWP
jgi:hypothetical protein